jgi:predicted ABC-type transport system involved in lysophospholipase L1 biosynthesis ATPase subunit
VHADGTAIVLVTHNAVLAQRAKTRLAMRSGVLLTGD